MTRSGIGFDSHRLAVGRRLVIGGVAIPHPSGLVGHSDADVLAHAVIDALFGAVAAGDIGAHFPDDDPKWDGADSMELLARENEQVVGGLVAVCIGDAEMELRHLAVAFHAQGRGVGRSLVAELCRIAKARNCRRIHTIARNTSAEFVRTLGFQAAPGLAPEHPLFLEHGIKFELMEKFIEQDAAPASNTAALQCRR